MYEILFAVHRYCVTVEFESTVKYYTTKGPDVLDIKLR